MSARPGADWVAAYQTPGIPWATASLSVSNTTPFEINFESVSKFFTVRNGGSSLVRVGFTRNGVLGTNYFMVNTGSVQEFDLRVKDVFLLGQTATATGVDVLAGLTTIHRVDFPTLTGSNPAPTGSAYRTGIG
jgi:hypothetical protein